MPWVEDPWCTPESKAGPSDITKFHKALVASNATTFSTAPFGRDLAKGLAVTKLGAKSNCSAAYSTLHSLNVALSQSVCGSPSWRQATNSIHFSSYQDNAYCIWRAVCAHGLVRVSFTSVDTEKKYDFVSVYDGPTPRAKRLVHASGSGLAVFGKSPIINATGSQATIGFLSDKSTHKIGFDATIECV